MTAPTLFGGHLVALLGADGLWCVPMPSLDHESLILLFRNQPELAPQLLREALHLELPAYTEARLASSDLTEVVPTEFRADAWCCSSRASPCSASSLRLSSHATSASVSVGPPTSRFCALVTSAQSSYSF